MSEAHIHRLLVLFNSAVDWDNLVPSCLAIAQELENDSKLTGAEKLATLQEVLRVLLKKAEMPEDKKEDIARHIGMTVPIVMKAAMLASKAPIVNQAVKTCWTCLKK